MMEISKAKMTLIASLAHRKMRQRHSLYVVEGTKMAEEFIGDDSVRMVVATPAWVENHHDLLSHHKCEIYIANDKQMKGMSTLATPPSVITVVDMPNIRQEADEITIDNSNLYLMLDGVQDPGNLGTIIRTADWFGIHTIFASPGTADLFNPKTIQSTMGSMLRTNFIYCRIDRLIDLHKEMPVYGMMLDGKSIYSASTGSYGFIVMGNEGNGISEEIKKRVTHPLLIPPYNDTSHPESLNVAISTGIVLSFFREHSI